MPEIPIKHHFVPQVYLKSWEDDKKLLWIYDIQKDEIDRRNKKSIMYYKHLYSITLREMNLLNEEQIGAFAEPLDLYDVFLDGRRLTKTEIVQNINRYEEFEIIDSKKGKSVTDKHRKTIFREMLNRKVPVIEEKYGNIEDGWIKVLSCFKGYKDFAMGKRNNLPKAETLKKATDILLNFILVLYTRNPYEHCYRIKRHEDKYGVSVNNEDSRKIFETIQLLSLTGERQLFDVSRYDINCIIAAEEQRFITSDNPVILRGIDIENCNFKGLFWFPLSPDILIVLSEKEEGNNGIRIKHYNILDESVIEFNKIIYSNAEQYIVSSCQIYQ